MPDLVSAAEMESIVLQRARTTFGVDGEPLQAFRTLVDITSRQRIRRKLDDATATLMAVWEHVPESRILTSQVRKQRRATKAVCSASA